MSVDESAEPAGSVVGPSEPVVATTCPDCRCVLGTEPHEDWCPRAAGGDTKLRRRSDMDLAEMLVRNQLEPPAWRELFQRVKFDTVDGDVDVGERFVVIVAKGEHADKIAAAYDRLAGGADPLADTVRGLLDEYHGDHNWAQLANERLELALHQADGCLVFRSDCALCQAELEASS